jgi:hypothetical protein
MSTRAARWTPHVPVCGSAREAVALAGPERRPQVVSLLDPELGSAQGDLGKLDPPDQQRPDPQLAAQLLRVDERRRAGDGERHVLELHPRHRQERDRGAALHREIEPVDAAQLARHGRGEPAGVHRPRRDRKRQRRQTGERDSQNGST